MGSQTRSPWTENRLVYPIGVYGIITACDSIEEEEPMTFPKLKATTEITDVV
jgi:hypothetical protein